MTTIVQRLGSQVNSCLQAISLGSWNQVEEECIMPRYKLNQFLWTAEERTLSTEISTLARVGSSAFGGVAGNQNGFEIESHHTGEVQTYVINRVEWSRENEILAWYLTTDDSDITVVVYND